MPDQPTERLYAANDAAATWYRAQLAHHRGPVAYLHARGLGAIVEREAPWCVGYAPRGWTGLVDHLRTHGFTDDEILAAGLAFRARDGRILDVFRDRLTFPLRDDQGRTVGFTARIWQNGADERKYINTRETAIYRKGEILYGLHEQRHRLTAGFAPVVVEGPTDTITLWLTYASTGRPGHTALATCGTALTEHQVRTLAGLPGARRSGLTVAYDADTAGAKAAIRAHQLLTANHPHLHTRSLRLAPGADPAALGATPAGRGHLRTLLHRAPPLLHAVIDARLDQLLDRRPQLLHEIEGRLLLADTLLPHLRTQPMPAIADAIAHLAEAVAVRTGHDQEAASGTAYCLTVAAADYLAGTRAA
jgi:DNA primase catalytic core